MSGRSAKKARALKPQTIKLDLGCGIRKTPGFIGVDIESFEGVDLLADLSGLRWSFDRVAAPALGMVLTKAGSLPDESVDEVVCSHFIEHLNAKQRADFVNELYRVLKDGAKAQITVPHWCSSRAYGDPTHQWPPIGEFWFFYLNAEWRRTQAPHTNSFYSCNFEVPFGYNLNPNLAHRNDEYRKFALENYKESASDIVATMTKRPMSAVI